MNNFYFNLHTHEPIVQDAVVALVNQYPWEFDATLNHYSIGIHPWYIKEDRIERDVEKIEQSLQLKECKALGECGLDKRIAIPLALQIAVFEKQIQLAEKYKKPLLIHCVAAFDELILLKNKHKITVPIIIHGFSKNEQLATQLLKNGFYLSFGKYLLQNPELKDVFKALPLNRIFLETDTITNSIQEVYAIAASYKQLSVADLQSQIQTNYSKIFI